VLLLLLNYLLFHVFFIGGASPAVWEFDPARCRKSFARMVITHEYPINCAKHHFLKVFISDLQPYFKMVLRNTLRLDCVKIYEERRVSLYELFGKLYYRFNFTSDLWTNKDKERGFMSLIYHYIDGNWHLRK
jgi:hypothetical protein